MNNTRNRLVYLLAELMSSIDNGFTDVVNSKRAELAELYHGKLAYEFVKHIVAGKERIIKIDMTIHKPRSVKIFGGYFNSWDYSVRG